MGTVRKLKVDQGVRFVGAQDSLDFIVRSIEGSRHMRTANVEVIYRGKSLRLGLAWGRKHESIGEGLSAGIAERPSDLGYVSIYFDVDARYKYKIENLKYP